MMHYSVIIAVYRGDRIDWLQSAVDSILNQTIQSNDIVIVRDGAVSDELESVLRDYSRKHESVRIIRLKENVGAGQARNEGVKCARNELIAIMDADDISLPNRFELQLAAFNNNSSVSLIGGQISEFQGLASNIVGYRKVPMEYSAIKKFARYRSPINHVTIMFKRSPFLKLGGYPQMTRAEDYCMISLFLSGGYYVSNLDKVLVNCRVNADNIRRRKSWRNVRENIQSRWKIHRLGVMPLMNFLISSLAQILLFLAPTYLVGVLFGLLLREKYE